MSCFYNSIKGRCLLLVLISLPHISISQPLSHHTELIIKLSRGIHLDDIDLNSQSRNRRSLIRYDTVSLERNIYLLQIQAEDYDRTLGLLREDHRIEALQPNYLLKARRKTPDDPMFKEQWNLDRVGIADVWEKTTGGVTYSGQTIVIGVMEAGIDVRHEDLSGILWANKEEVPNNDLDDDGNGYVDDYFGVSTDNGRDDHIYDPSGHGSSVISVMAAKGNNSFGITGANWNVKIALYSTDDLSMANAIKAYSYFTDLRRRFNETGGRNGALIVTTNSSFGRDGLFEADAPIFCEMFSEMGKQGILNVAAAENDHANADVFGDIPSTCTANELIIVTNSNHKDELAIAGFGANSVDIAAPGVRILTADIKNEFSTNSGTSYASPLVCGAVALLYSHPSPTFANLVIKRPVEAAGLVKNLILQNAFETESLSKVTVSGGRLDLTKTYQALNHLYPVEEETRDVILLQNLVADHLVLYFQKILSRFTLRLYDVSGKMVLEQSVQGGPSFYQLELNHLPNGAYFLVTKNNTHFSTNRIVKY